jgi:hypothetical protein
MRILSSRRLSNRVKPTPGTNHEFSNTLLEVSDIRFLDDDVKALLELRLICHEDGTLFRITRSAVRFIETIDKKPGPNV